MKRITKLSTFALAAALLLMIAGGAVAEHPTEHPKEHPSSKAKMSLDMLAKGIEDFIAADAALKGGWFTIWDEKAQAPLALELVKVHKEEGKPRYGWRENRGVWEKVAP